MYQHYYATSSALNLFVGFQCHWLYSHGKQEIAKPAIWLWKPTYHPHMTAHGRFPNEPAFPLPGPPPLVHGHCQSQVSLPRQLHFIVGFLALPGNFKVFIHLSVQGSWVLGVGLRHHHLLRSKYVIDILCIFTWANDAWKEVQSTFELEFWSCSSCLSYTAWGRLM